MEPLRLHFGFKTLLIFFSLVLPLTAQTRAELDKQYGPSVDGVYRVRQGIAVQATFSENGSAKTLRIVADNPKDKNALLRADDVRKVIGELLGNRMACRPKSAEQIEIACPPRKGCSGFKEEWKSHSTLMVWYKKSVVSASMTLFDPPPTPPPGNIKLLPGYRHLPSCGFDTSVGDIQKVGGMQIRYDIGDMAGNFAKRYGNPYNTEWIRTEKVGEDAALIVLTKQNRIYATFERSTANFFATISSQSDIDDFLEMVLTYKSTAN